MKTSITVGGATHVNIRGMVDFVQQAERLGVDYVWSAEAWGQDAVTSLAYLAGQTSRIMLGTGVIQISARTPSMTAMTALALHDLGVETGILQCRGDVVAYRGDKFQIFNKALANGGALNVVSSGGLTWNNITPAYDYGSGAVPVGGGIRGKFVTQILVDFTGDSQQMAGMLCFRARSKM